MKIGVFDSGLGGTFIAERLRTLLPGHEWIVIDDRAHVPYGEKDQATIVRLTKAAITPLLTDCPIVVLACNTATAAAIDTLRKHYPHTQFVGVEPMIKPAATASPNHHITVLATPFTLHSERYGSLREAHATGVVVDEPETHGWPRAIDEAKMDEIDLSSIRHSVASGSDTIVLACTHFLALQERLESTFPDITILEPSEALARQIQRLMS